MQDKFNAFTKEAVNIIIKLPEDERTSAFNIILIVGELCMDRLYNDNNSLETAHSLLFYFHFLITTCQSEKISSLLKELAQKALVIIAELFPKQCEALINAILIFSVTPLLGYGFAVALSKNEYSFSNSQTHSSEENEIKQDHASTISTATKTQVAKSLGNFMSAVTEEQQQPNANYSITRSPSPAPQEWVD